MGTLILPAAGPVYVDANTVIYSVESHPAYSPLLRPLWLAARAQSLDVISSELLILETLVGPCKVSDPAMEQAYEQVLTGSELRLIAISAAILRLAARLRAATKLRMPDSIHVATALSSGCTLFVTNDLALRVVAGLSVVVLDDLLSP